MHGGILGVIQMASQPLALLKPQRCLILRVQLKAITRWTHQSLWTPTYRGLHRPLPVLLPLHHSKNSKTALQQWVLLGALPTAWRNPIFALLTLLQGGWLACPIEQLQSHITEKPWILLGLSNPGFVLLPLSITTMCSGAHHFAQSRNTCVLKVFL